MTQQQYKFRYVFLDPEDNIHTYYQNEKVPSLYTFEAEHPLLFLDSNGEEIYSMDFIKVMRGDSLKPHISQVVQFGYGSPKIYHKSLKHLTGNGYEDATYWMTHECLTNKPTGVYLYKRWEDVDDNEYEQYSHNSQIV